MTRLQNVKMALALSAAATLGVPASAEQVVGTASAVNPAATVNLRTISIGSSIAHKERVRTTASGSVQVLFIDKTSMTVGPNSDVTIDEYVFDPKAGTGNLAATVGKGAMRFVGGLISHNGNAEIKTPTATIGIRGGVAIVNGPSVYAGYGSTSVTSGGVTVTLGANEYTQTGNGNPPTPPGPPPPGFVTAMLQLFQSAGGQTGGVSAGTASRGNVAAAERRATGSTSASVAGALTPPPPIAPVNVQTATTNTNLTQTIQTSAQTAAAQTIADQRPVIDPRPSVTLNGFVGAVDQVKADGINNTPVAGTAQVVLDATGNKVQANFTAFGNTRDTFQFGSTDPMDPTASVYTNYNNFSAQSKQGGTFNGIPYSGEMNNVSPDAAKQLAAAAGKADLTLCQCDYTRWGFWSVRNPTNTESIFGLWVAGRPAQASDVPVTGTATYIGQVVANVGSSGSNALKAAAGNFSNEVNFGTRTGAVAVTGLDSTNYSGTVALQGNTANFAGALAGNVGNRQMGLVGSFYRSPTNPVGEMGGSVVIQGTNYVGGGVFTAARR
ncbi:FecR domain-containing protein [uncultured Bradyrhizobium sp.]|uniref:FecR domain-containing protein n=1 Tax=uncultured Bradyrhizobium sp. TaxID=199684 RepID=UPI0035C98F1E